MDEILIEERKYVSSKRAAKITGYAKDYIGQLCREGRVPARLVGRSWYVLEAAIQDHRFGSPAEEPAKPVKAQEESSLQSTWAAPRFEAYSAELLPSINRLATPLPDNQEKTPDEPLERLEDSWHAWFNRMADHTEPIIPAEPVLENRESEAPESKPEPEQEKEENEEVNVPVHAIYEPVIQESLPHITKDIGEERFSAPQQKDKPIRQEKRRSSGKAAKRMRIIGASLAIISIIIAAIGSGYFDEYVVSSSQARFIAGISVYNK